MLGGCVRGVLFCRVVWCQFCWRVVVCALQVEAWQCTWANTAV